MNEWVIWKRKQKIEKESKQKLSLENKDKISIVWKTRNSKIENDQRLKKYNSYYSYIKNKICNAYDYKISDQDFDLTLGKNNHNLNNILLKNPDIQNILFFGDVQSGKTNNMMLTIATLMDRNINKIFILTGTKNNLRNQTKLRLEKIFDQENISIVEFTKFNEFLLRKKEPVIFYGHKTEFKLLTNFFDSPSDEIITNNSVAIIDDEADESSAKKDKKSSRSVNKSITDFLDFQFKKKYYILLTASPYVNLTSESDLLIPQAVIPLISSSDYCGLEDFSNNYEILDPSIATLFSDSDFMDNTEVKEYIESKIVKFAKEIKNNEMVFDFLVNIFNEQKDISNVYSYFQKVLRTLTISNKIDSDLRNIINGIQLRKITQDNNELTADDNTKSKIVIGGYLLSRGITFENLLYELFLNESNAADTTMQRARWLGYRKNKIDNMKIFLNQKSYDIFCKLDEINKLIKWMYGDDFLHTEEKRIKLKKIFKDNKIKPTNK